MCTAQVESHIFSKTWIFHKKKNNSFEKFVLTSFDRATPSERQKFTFGSFNFWLWKWISQKVSFTFKNDKLALHFDRLQQNLVPILFPITISIITIMLNLDKRKCVKGGKMRIKSVSIFQTWPSSHDVKIILNCWKRIKREGWNSSKVTFWAYEFVI